MVQANPEIKRGSERDVEGDFERERERLTKGELESQKIGEEREEAS